MRWGDLVFLYCDGRYLAQRNAIAAGKAVSTMRDPTRCKSHGGVSPFSTCGLVSETVRALRR